MPKTAFPGTYRAPSLMPLGPPIPPRSTEARSVPAQATIRRRANIQQGRALEILGHAVEYLVDSRMFLIHEPATRADAEATTILMRLSREVFTECAELVSPGRALHQWILRQIRSSAN